jgi:hypothetical protein
MPLVVATFRESKAPAMGIEIVRVRSRMAVGSDAPAGRQPATGCCQPKLHAALTGAG